MTARAPGKLTRTTAEYWVARWRGCLPPFFPVGNGEAIAPDIPGARLLVLEEAATAIPDAAAGEVAEAILTLG